MNIKNRPRRFAKNVFGISICPTGRITITKPAYEFLGNPEYVRFVVHNSDWLIIIPLDSNSEDLNDAVRVNVGRTVRNVYSIETTRRIFKEFSIVRNDRKRTFPFYYSIYEDDVFEYPVVLIRMKDFDEYRQFLDSNINSDYYGPALRQGASFYKRLYDEYYNDESFTE